MARNLENGSAHRDSVGKLRGKEDLENPNVDVGILLKWIL